MTDVDIVSAPLLVRFRCIAQFRPCSSLIFTDAGQRRSFFYEDVGRYFSAFSETSAFSGLNPARIAWKVRAANTAEIVSKHRAGKEAVAKRGMAEQARVS